MADSPNNLLLRLHKWAWRQDENFLTETFAHLLQHLLENESEVGVHIANAVTGGLLQLRPEEAPLISVRTQVLSAEGTPDLEIRIGTRKLALLEVKSQSEAGAEQLARYRNLLRESNVTTTALVLLTRYPVSVPLDGVQPDAFVRWFQVAEWLEQECGRYKFKPVSAFLVNQFVSFLGARNMTMGQVTWDLSGGVRALRTLGDMLLEVAHACGLQAMLQGHRNSLGVYLEKRAYWLGIRYDEPESLRFSTYNRAVNPALAERKGIDGVFSWPGEPWNGWRRLLDLDSEEVHFFARSKASQMQVLEGFLSECMATVRQIEITGAIETAGPGSPDVEPPEPPPA